MNMKTTLLIALLAANGFCGERSYLVVGTGQTKCYDNRREVTPPKPGQPFYGQDAQCRSVSPAYTLSLDGLTVDDLNTGLTWQRSPDTNGDGSLTYADKLTYREARQRPAAMNAAKYGGYNDWRLPTIKELYSLIVFSGVDVGRIEEATRAKPFIDTNYFDFAYGFLDSGDRSIDSQWATSTLYVANPNQMFGVNFADGRIKAYPLAEAIGKRYFVICVRGNPAYGKNDFHDNDDGTITDRATGLMWSKTDSGKGMNWEAALAWAHAKNVGHYLGHDDWRLPNAKELQSIVDYTRSPDTTRSPAIDPLFHCTAIKNENGKSDYPFYWTSTTHASAGGSESAIYVAFGRAAGWLSGPPGQHGGPGRGVPGMEGDRSEGPGNRGPRPFGPPPEGFAGPPPFGPPWGDPGMMGPPRHDGSNSGSAMYHYADVHGAGAQRSDPKIGDPNAFPHGRGPQGDVIRIDNYVRVVRGGLKP
jgi:hypothetical protein